MFIYDKKIVCPVCNKEFTTKQVKTGKARFVGSEEDLRPIYTGIDTVKYDVWFCPHCGYASVAREFNNLTQNQIRNIRENISAKYTGTTNDTEIYSYDIAIHRYKMALLTTMVKPDRLSESAYLCLKLSWLYRGAAQELENGIPDEEKPSGEVQKKLSEYKKNETQYMKQAYDGFSQALLKEYPPICNMDEMTVDYLMAVLALRCDDYDASQKYAFMIISSRTASAKVKEKAREHIEKLRNIKGSE
jgi:uncharacterized protein (DUF2225 family)